MKNALNLEDYAYDASTRDDVKRELGVPAESYVVGHVGRFSEQKNHLFLVDVFAEIARRRPDASSFSSAKARHARPLRGALPSSD